MCDGSEAERVWGLELEDRRWVSCVVLLGVVLNDEKDLSIAPLNVGANTCNTGLIIGEKAAGIIIHELGIISKSSL